MIEVGIVSLLKADATVAGLVGPRLFPVLVPEGSMPVNAGDPPCLSYQIISASAAYTLDPKELDTKRVQFDAWGVAYSDCKNVKQAVRNALDGYKGTLPDGTRVLGTFRGVEVDFWEDASRVYRVLFEYTFQFVEP